MSRELLGFDKRCAQNRKVHESKANYTCGRKIFWNESLKIHRKDKSFLNTGKTDFPGKKDQEKILSEGLF